MPARLKRRNRREKRKLFSYISKLILFLTIALIFVFFLKFQKIWKLKDKISLVLRNPDGDISLLVLDPEFSEMTKVQIPGDVEVEVARRLGKRRLKTLWQLGKEEGEGGLLLARTVTKHFKFPVYLWADSLAAGFWDRSPLLFLKGVFYPYETNLKFLERVRIALFAINVKDTKKQQIDLSKSSYLKKTTLADGEEGFVVSGSIPQNLMLIFTDNSLAQATPRVTINDRTGKPEIAKEVSQVLEVLGAKVSSLKVDKEEEGECEIMTKVQDISQKIANFLPCSVSKKPPQGNFDIEINLKKGFVKRF